MFIDDFGPKGKNGNGAKWDVRQYFDTGIKEKTQ